MKQKVVYPRTGICLKVFRESLKISQADLSKKVGVHVQVVSNWERGLAQPPKQVRKKLLKVLKLDNADRKGLKYAIEQDNSEPVWKSYDL